MVKFRFRSVPQDKNRTGSEKNDFMKILSIFCNQIWYLPILPKLLNQSSRGQAMKVFLIRILVFGQRSLILLINPYPHPSSLRNRIRIRPSPKHGSDLLPNSDPTKILRSRSAALTNTQWFYNGH